MNLLKWGRRSQEMQRWQSIDLDQVIAQLGQFSYNGVGYGPGIIQTMTQNHEEIQRDFEGFIAGAYKSSGPIFALIMTRMFLFSEARFQFRRQNNGRPGKLFGTQDLRILEQPDFNVTTGDMLARALLDVDLAGNWFATTVRDPKAPAGKRMVRLRPDWMTIVKGSVQDASISAYDPTAELVGYLYHPGGHGSGLTPKAYLPNEIAHFAPIPDPDANYRGMSWIQPVLQEILGDKAMMTHKLMFFQNGAPQPLSARVLTPKGWATMGDVRVGDDVLGRDGVAHEVRAVYPQGEQDVYRVKFSDGTSTECTLDHLWSVANCRDRQLDRYRSLPLRQIVAEGIRYPSGATKWSVPMAEPAQFESPGPQPIDPYFMGLLLGDGSFRGNKKGSGGVTLTVADDDYAWTEKAVEAVLPSGVVAHPNPKVGCSEVYFARIPAGRGSGLGRANRLTQQVRSLGLYDLDGEGKFIPDPYLRGSVDSRVALLQGLVDSDGHVEKGQCSVSVTTVSSRLAEGIVDLVGSLGGMAKITPVKGRRTLEVDIRRLPDWIVPCRLPRKVANYRTSSNRTPRYRLIDSVEYVRRDEVQCIHLDGEEHLYITDDYIVTHNSPNLVISMDTGKMDVKTFQEWVDQFELQNTGSFNAYKSLYLGQGATAQVVGANLRELEYHSVMGQGETRLASASGVPPMLAGFSEGLQALTLQNFQMARRLFADRTLRPMWRNMSASLSSLVPPPPGSQLWYDDRDIAFLQDDAKDGADILLTKATAMRMLTDAGFTPDSVVNAVESNDMTLLEHSGMFSVQLHPPGQEDPDQQSTVPGSNQNGNKDNLASADLRGIIRRSRNPEELAQALLTAKAGD